MSDTPTPRNPRAEAQALLGDALEARVLEPSPPAIDDGEWFADDPVATDGATAPVVAPSGTGALQWNEWLREHPEHEGWAAEHWLSSHRRLPRVPDRFAETRLALHRVAAYVVSPARRRVNGKIGLRWTRGGFGTPFYGQDEQVRVEAGDLVLQCRGDVTTVPLTSLRRAAAFVLDGDPDVEWAAEFDVPEPGDLDAELPVDREAAAWLGDWFGFAWSVLEEVRADPDSTEASRVQLWPEHFDAAFECLSDAGKRRAGFGASPGDAAVDEPYLYVVPWYFDEVPPGPVWNAESFRGAILPFSEFRTAEHQRETALAFFRACRDALTA